MKSKKFSLTDRLKSFKYAFNGFHVLFRDEHNARVHLFSAVLVIILGLFLSISAFEWMSITIVMGLVFICEIFNSSIENIADFISPEKHDQIKTVKDLAAAAVLISAIISIVVGLIVFLPKIIPLVNHYEKTV